MTQSRQGFASSRNGREIAFRAPVRDSFGRSLHGVRLSKLQSGRGLAACRDRDVLIFHYGSRIMRVPHCGLQSLLRIALIVCCAALLTANAPAQTKKLNDLSDYFGKSSKLPELE